MCNNMLEFNNNSTVHNDLNKKRSNVDHPLKVYVPQP